MPSGTNGTELIDALIMNDFEVVQQILSGTDIDLTACDDVGNTALIWAVFSTEKDIITTILERGADVNAANRIGTTVLMWAVQTGDPDIVDMLLQRGAGVTATNDMGQTALDVIENSLNLSEPPAMDSVAKALIVELLKNPPAVAAVAAQVFEASPVTALRQAQLRKMMPLRVKLF